MARNQFAKPKRCVDIAIGLLGLCVVLAFPYFAGKAALKGINNYNAAKSWEQTSGIVASSKRPPGRNRNPEIWYRYEVDEQIYWSNGLGVDGSSAIFSFNDSKNLVENHPVGSEVTVYYDPASPEKALLYRNLSVGTWINGIMFLVCGVGIAVIAIRILLDDWLRKKHKFRSKLARYEARQIRRGYRMTPDPSNTHLS